MWEYAVMWHRANWIGNWETDGWRNWVMQPLHTAGPPPDADDLAALNHMGRLRWDVVQVESTWDFPPGVQLAQHGGAARRQYLLKRPLLDEQAPPLAQGPLVARRRPVAADPVEQAAVARRRPSPAADDGDPAAAAPRRRPAPVAEAASPAAVVRPRRRPTP